MTTRAELLKQELLQSIPNLVEVNITNQNQIDEIYQQKLTAPKLICYTQPVTVQRDHPNINWIQISNVSEQNTAIGLPYLAVMCRDHEVAKLFQEIKAAMSRSIKAEGVAMRKVLI
jgi:hypothetical protein